MLSALLGRLSSLGQHYAPMVIGTELDATAPSTLGFNVRLTTQDVILARTDLPASQFSVANPQAQHFSAQLVVPTPVGPVPLTRGWASVDATVDGHSFRFVTTHLDTGAAVGPAIQLAQAQELLATAGATTLPVIYAGDFNSSADDPLDPTFPTYEALIGAGLGDAWTTLHPGDPGFTCCEDPSLLNVDPTLTQRIDLALFTAPFGVADAHLIGISPFDKTDDGLWVSDHAGLVATFVLPAPEPASMLVLAVGLVGLGAVRRRKVLVLTLTSAILFGAMAERASATNYSALYVFGDSLSDVGNAAIATAGAIPGPPYATGRYSNGPVWVEGLALRLGLAPLLPSLAGGTDYAVGGAHSGATPVHVANAGDLPAQYAQFAATHPVAPSNALYTIAIGSNDLFSVLELANPLAAAGPTIGAVVSNIGSVMAGLAAAGARDFLVMTVPDLGVTPAVTVFGPAASSVASSLSAALDAALTTSLAGGSFDVRFLDAFALLDREVADPAAFGFVDVTNPCWTGDYFGNGGTLCDATVAGQNAHLFWDRVHPTAAGHAVLADEAILLVPEPASVGLFAVGLFGIVALCRGRRLVRVIG